MSWFLRLNTGQQLRYSSSDNEEKNPIQQKNGYYSIDVGNVRCYRKDPDNDNMTLVPVNHVEDTYFVQEKICGSPSTICDYRNYARSTG